MSDRHTIQPYPLRLQPELRATLEQSAKERGRSLHAEIVARLEESFKRDLMDAKVDLLLHSAAQHVMRTIVEEEIGEDAFMKRLEQYGERYKKKDVE